MNVMILIRNAKEGGFWVEVPSLPGCFSQGETLEEALENTREAVKAHLGALCIEGQEAAPPGDILIGYLTLDD